MWVVRATEAEDLGRLKVQRGQERWRAAFTEKYALAMAMCGSITGEWDGEVLCVAGIVERWAGCGLAHAIISANAGPHFKRVIGSIREHLETGHRYNRVECYVLTNWDEAHRMARVLGFRREGTMQQFDVYGNDCDLYARTYQWTQ